MLPNDGPKGNASARPFRALWLWLSISAAVLAIGGSAAAFLAPTAYAGLTVAFLPQAVAQDAANLVFVSPLMILLAFLSLRGSLRAYLSWLGFLTFTVYNYVIYTFSIPFGPSFPSGLPFWASRSTH